MSRPPILKDHQIRRALRAVAARKAIPTLTQLAKRYGVTIGGLMTAMRRYSKNS